MGGVTMCIVGIWVYVNFQALPVPQLLNSIVGLASALPSSLAKALRTGGLAPTGNADYFSGAVAVQETLEEQLGEPLRARRIVLYRTYAVLEASDPKQPESIVNYTLRSGSVTRVSTVPRGSSQARLDQTLFSLSDVDFAHIPALIRAAVAEMALSESNPSHVIIEREPTARESRPVIRVYVTNPLANGYVEYSLDGRKIRVVK